MSAMKCFRCQSETQKFAKEKRSDGCEAVDKFQISYRCIFFP